MARIRTVKPEFFTDEDLGELPPTVRLLFIAMWTEADKAGRLKDKPKTIKARCIPFDPIDIEKALRQLAASRFIIRYSSGGERYIQIRTWHEHQRPHHTERESTYPPVLEGEVTETTTLTNGVLTVEQPSLDGEKKDSRNREPSFPFPSFPFLSLVLEESVEFKAAWGDWVKHRKEIKKPLTEQQVRKQIKEFEQWGPERSIAAIEHTIKKGWQGLREPDTQSGAAPRSTQLSIEELLDRAQPKDQGNGQLE
jgi:hypothetical protein